MNDSELQLAVARLVLEISRMADAQCPWVTVDEMQARYGRTLKTLATMERRGETPRRAKGGKWLRSELVQWESRTAIPASQQDH